MHLQQAYNENGEMNLDPSDSRPCSQIGLLIILSIVFILVTTATVMSFNLQRVVYDPTRLETVLEEEWVDSGLFSRFAGALIRQRSDQSMIHGTQDLWLLLSGVSDADLETITEIIVTRDIQKSLISSSLEGLQLWLRFDDAPLQFNWNLVPVKTHLAGNPGQQALSIAFASLPDCTQEEVNVFLSQASTGEIAMEELCRLPEPLGAQQQALFNAEMLGFGAAIPETYQFNTLQNATPELTRTLTRIRSVLEFSRFLGRWGWMISFVVLLTIAAIGLRSLDSAGVWFGLPLIISGMLTLAAAVVSRVFLLGGLNDRLVISSNPELDTVLELGVLNLSDHLFQPMLWQGVALLTVGGLLFVVMALRKIITQSRG